MFRRILGLLSDDSRLERKAESRLSLLSLAVAGLMSFFTYTHEGRLWDTHVTFRPSFLSTIVALLLVSPLYLRRILTWNRSLYSIFSFLLILAFFSSLVQLAIGGNAKSTFILPLLAIATALSWLGLREVAGASWLVVLIAGALAAVTTNLALGFYGFLYLACGVIGLSLHAGLNPGQLVSGTLQEFGRGPHAAIRPPLESNAQEIPRTDA